MDNIQQLQSILEKFKKMSPEEFKKIINTMYEQVVLSEDIFNLFIEDLIKYKRIDSEDINYFPDNYNTSLNNFYLINCYLDNYIDGNINNASCNVIVDLENPFLNQTCIFKYRNIYFERYMISGQGTCYVYSISKPIDVYNYNDLYILENFTFEILKRK